MPFVCEKFTNNKQWHGMVSHHSHSKYKKIENNIFTIRDFMLLLQTDFQPHRWLNGIVSQRKMKKREYSNFE